MNERKPVSLLTFSAFGKLFQGSHQTFFFDRFMCYLMVSTVMAEKLNLLFRTGRL